MKLTSRKRNRGSGRRPVVGAALAAIAYKIAVKAAPTAAPTTNVEFLGAPCPA